ncbi:hypothetical protein EPN96_02025 [bacterium]|nr:MAG: hypothetical protein EPN96_02025 [bacterium]
MSSTTITETSNLKRLNDAVLLPGDILLTTSTEKFSKGIRRVTKSDISHAMIYVDDRSIIDATGEGVHARNTQRLFYEEDCPVYALRLRDNLNATSLQKILTYMRGHIGAQYSYKEAALTALGGAHSFSKKQFCSRLVAQAFESAGILLVGDSNYCSPEDIKSSPLLIEVSDSTVPATHEELLWNQESVDITKLMRESTNTILTGARDKDPTIQTFDDMDNYLVANPECDDEFCQLLNTSGYLTIWKTELDKNPWQYNIYFMNEMPPDVIEEYCWSVLKSEKSGPHRYISNRMGYNFLFRQHNLKFFRIMMELFEHLASLHQQRIRVATSWLEINGHLTESKASILEPHTPEWFAALEQWDLHQAKQTREIINLAGSSDVCSICGDDTANDHVLIKSQRPPGGPGTLRLCDDCLKIRGLMGEQYLPLNDQQDENIH